MTDQQQSQEFEPFCDYLSSPDKIDLGPIFDSYVSPLNQNKSTAFNTGVKQKLTSEMSKTKPTEDFFAGIQDY